MDMPQGAMSPTVMRLSDNSTQKRNKKSNLANTTTLTRRNDKKRVFIGKSQETET